MKTKITLFLGLTAIFASCANSSEVVDTFSSQTEVDRVKTYFPDYSLTEFEAGKHLYESHCGSCHNLKSPASESEEGWKGIVPPMVKKANKNSGSNLSAQDEQAILRYVLTMGPYAKK